VVRRPGVVFPLVRPPRIHRAPGNLVQDRVASAPKSRNSGHFRIMATRRVKPMWRRRIFPSTSCKVDEMLSRKVSVDNGLRPTILPNFFVG